VNVDIATGTAQDGYGSTDTFTNINFVRGSNFDDTLRGSDAIGWTESFEGRAGNDLIDGRGGRDTVRYDIAVGPVVVNLALGSATGADGSDTLLGIENVRGSNSFADTLTGDGADNQLEGRGGNDSLVGGDGQDTLLGSIGNDTLDGGAQAAIVPDDSGAFPGTLLFFDIVDYSAAAGAVNVNLATGSASGGDGSDVLSGIEGVRGTAGNDTLTGDSGHNLLRGNAGDDRLVGGAGFDIADLSTATVGVSASLVTGIVTGGAGNDTLSGIEMLIGGSGNDTLTGNSQNNIIRGNLGNDSMTGGGGIDSVDYRSAPGSVTVNLAAGTATGADGDDRLSGFEQIRGSDAGNDLLIGNDGANYLRGGGGGDVLVGGAGNDTLNGSTITDLVNYSDSNTVDYSAVGAGVAVNLQTGVAEDGQGGTDTLIDINFVIGTTQGDTLTGSTALLFEQFSPGAGNDTVDGGAVTDTLNLGNSNRVSYANTSESVTVDLALGTATGNAIGSDTLINIIQAAGSSANDTLRGSNNTLDEAFRGHGGNDLIDGRGGFDFARYDTFGSTGAKVNLATRIALDGLGGTDTLISIEGIRGSNANDTLTGGNAASNALERFLAMAGNDTINGGSGFDRAEYHMSTAAVTVTLGGAGVGTAQDGYGSTDTLISVEAVRGSVYDDTLTGSSVATLESFEGREGNDTINGVAGLDRVDYHYSKAGIVVDLAAGTASDGWGGADRLLNIDDVLGSRDFADSIVGSAGNNRLEGQGSNDTLVGAAGNDTLDGGSGNDTLNGGAGNDSLIGGAGADSMVGGDGNDTYVVGAGDRLNETGTTSSAADLVQSSITWSIAGAGQTTIERLTLTGTAFGGTGNSRANLITGNSAANSLSGGSGNDTLNGGSGNDTLSGGAGNDSLVGGSGADSMLGGSGNDTYVVGTGDRLNETGTTSSTADLVQSSISWALSGTGQAAIERLALIGSSAINGTGNDLANLITGNGAANRLGGGLRNDTLSGGLGNDTLVGGAGNDSLTGGGGRDVFRFDAALSAATNVDKVSGFVAADDAFQLENAVFVEVGAAGALAASAFRAGASATMASHRIVYHSSTGQLFFDSDGSGAAAQVLFATVAPGTAITAADFFVT
jgi:Ca2+-binding RTX toxin-like protein